MLFPYYCFAVSRLSSVVGITSSNRILSGINLYLCLQYMDGNAQPLLGETLRGKGGNPHFCYGFRVPPFPLSFIPLTPAGSRTGHKRLTRRNKVILTYHSVGSRTGHKRLTLWSKVSLHTIPQAVGQVTNGSPCGTKHPYTHSVGSMSNLKRLTRRNKASFQRTNPAIPKHHHFITLSHLLQ